LDAAFTTRQSLRIRVKTPKHKLGILSICRRGVSETLDYRRGAGIRPENFYGGSLAIWLLAEMMKNLTILELIGQRRRPIPEVVGAAPMLKNK
jgi:hypothetical protein